jgi:hypothetical protein
MNKKCDTWPIKNHDRDRSGELSPSIILRLFDDDVPKYTHLENNSYKKVNTQLVYFCSFAEHRLIHLTPT